MATADDHPTEDTWEKLATGELTGDARVQAMAHVVACPRCARTWRALRQIARDAREFDPGVPVTAPASETTIPLHRTRRALVIGGSVAIAAAAALLLWIRFGDRPGSVARDGITRGGQITTVELAPASATHLAWKSVPGAETYSVTVFSLDGRIVWSRANITPLAVDVDPPLGAGDYRWIVEAWAHGERVAVSTPTRFAVAR